MPAPPSTAAWSPFATGWATRSTWKAASPSASSSWPACCANLSRPTPSSVSRRLEPMSAAARPGPRSSARWRRRCGPSANTSRPDGRTVIRFQARPEGKLPLTGRTLKNSPRCELACRADPLVLSIGDPVDQRTAMPSFQALVGELNAGFGKEQIFRTSELREGFAPGQPLHLALAGLAAEPNSVEHRKFAAFVQRAPGGIQETLRSTIYYALGTSPPTLVTFAWAPAYDYEM